MNTYGFITLGVFLFSVSVGLEIYTVSDEKIKISHIIMIYLGILLFAISVQLLKTGLDNLKNSVEYLTNQHNTLLKEYINTENNLKQFYREHPEFLFEGNVK